MEKIILIGLGGFTGALLRYGVSGVIQNWSRSVSFPYGTLIVNILGCFIIGSISQLAESRGFFSPEARAFLLIGLLGAFTTFSTFGNETVKLITNGENFLSLANIGAHLVLGLGAVWLGRVVVATLWR